MNMLFDLTGKTALVTGCSRGIGQGIAVGLAEAGCDIIGMSATLAPGGTTENMVVALDRSFTPYACDLSDKHATIAFCERVLSAHGVPDILVCNAGTIRRAPAAEHPDEWFDEVVQINLNSQFYMAKRIGKGMVERGRGKIVFTASLLSYQGGITVPGYAASKGGVAQLTKALANEWAGKGVNVNAIVPGYIATDVTQALQDDPVRSEQILTRIPAGRWGSPDDFKGPAIFLCSDAAGYVHGELLCVDGGWMSR